MQGELTGSQKHGDGRETEFEPGGESRGEARQREDREQDRGYGKLAAGEDMGTSGKGHNGDRQGA
ncbi:hypothetical protein GCM10023063_39260 [Arthrobacter methylotrophus]